ncbi:MAG: hypothetical protein JWS12_992 [Candidatus Saccharibacteria bacterium]|nr:hypothetical protein [Candidatus Saccharibacteria bacterium]
MLKLEQYDKALHLDKPREKRLWRSLFFVALVGAAGMVTSVALEVKEHYKFDNLQAEQSAYMDENHHQQFSEIEAKIQDTLETEADLALTMVLSGGIAAAGYVAIMVRKANQNPPTETYYA